MKYKVGDYIKNKELGTISYIWHDLFDMGKEFEAGRCFQIYSVAPSPQGCWHGSYKFSVAWKTIGELEKGYDVINYKEEKLTNKNTMKITNLVKKILDKDTRTLVSAGFINGDLALTEEGASELISIMFLEKKDELVKIAEDKINDSKTNR